ncbi:protein-L-isoaspartate O-methyltransferase family protein [Actinosynnema sp. CS-041913]|uniref:protein-L-isoaspartate O-methyltransferase family protein n=1 Tax=Actinosynnema sp. CS-041913 TaxID=3239917 RepID=UPI003D926E56
MTDTVTAAAATVDYDAWVKTEDGRTVPQSTADSRIRDMLAMLDLRPGARVLEIGTGSGYSGALLSRIVGETGRVVSIDIDPLLVARAARLHTDAGHGNVEVYASDGFEGWNTGAPFDRIVGWTTPHVLPAAWVDQTALGGIIVTPVKIADIACANVLIRCEIRDGIRSVDVRPGNFIEMAPEVVTELALPQRFVNASVVTEGAPPWWISAHELHDQPRAVAERLLDQAHIAVPRPDFLPVGRDKWQAFNAFVLAGTATPASLGTSWGWGIGVGLVDSIAVILPTGALLSAGTGEARDLLAELVGDWYERGEPSHNALHANFLEGPDGWTVRATLRDVS